MYVVKRPPNPFIQVYTLKFIYSEKATKFNLLLSYVVPVKSKVKIAQNFVAFSEYMNFKGLEGRLVVQGPLKIWTEY